MYLLQAPHHHYYPFATSCASAKLFYSGLQLKDKPPIQVRTTLLRRGRFHSREIYMIAGAKGEMLIKRASPKQVKEKTVDVSQKKGRF